MRRLVLPALAFALAVLACSSASQVSLPTNLPSVGETPGGSARAAATATAAPSSTPTTEPSPTAVPSLAIEPQTLGQLRLLWTVKAPGKGSPLTSLQCEGSSCDMLTRVGAYAFSPDSRLLAVGTCVDSPTENKSDNRHPRYACPAGGEVQLYTASTGEARGRITLDGFPRSLAFDSQGKTLATGTSDGKIELWDLASTQLLQTLEHPSSRTGVTSLAFSPDGTQLISQGDGKIVVWDRAKGSPLKTLSGWGALSFDAAGQRLVTAWYDSGAAATIARIFDLAHLGQSKDIRPKFVQPNMLDQDIRAGFSPDGKSVVILGSNGAEWWDAERSKMEGHTDIRKLVEEKKDAFSPIGAFMPDGMVLTEPGLGLSMPGLPLPPVTLGGTFACGFALWNPTTPGAYGITAPPMGCQALTAMGDSRRAVVSPDGALVAADDGAGDLRVWGVDATAAPVEATCMGTCQK